MKEAHIPGAHTSEGLTDFSKSGRKDSEMQLWPFGRIIGLGLPRRPFIMKQSFSGWEGEGSWIGQESLGGGLERDSTSDL